MLVNQIIQYLYSSNIKDFVVEDNLLGLFEGVVGDEINKVSITDIRSAAFYACGLSQKNDAPVVMIVRREYLSNTLTALTEAWFQRRCIIVIALASNILNDTLNCYRNCSSVQYKVQELDDFTSCFENMRRDLPVVFLVECEIEDVPLKYSIDIAPVANELSEGSHLFVYSAVVTARNEYKNVSYIETEFKYGTLSKFLGHCISNTEKSILLTDLSILKLDMNIFNSRYLDKRFNLIVTGQKPAAEILRWIKSNDIDIAFRDSAVEAVKAIRNSNKAMVVFLVTTEVESTCTQTL